MPTTHTSFQRDYFGAPGRHARIALGETPCVRRHFAQTIAPLFLQPGSRVLELGCGLGRFTALLLAQGCHVTALDISPVLIDQLRVRLGASAQLTSVVGRAEDVPTLVTGSFDAVVGFFFLHHVTDLTRVFSAITHVMPQGGAIAFCEPNAWNPLVYLQVTLTPGMSWRGERGIPHMRPGVVFPAMRAGGFVRPASASYGMLPPVIANGTVGGRVERGLEALPFLRPFSAYRTFHATLPARR